MPKEAAKRMKTMSEEAGMELGDWSLPSKSDDSLSLDLDLGALTAAIRASGSAISRKISETKIESRLSAPISNTTLNVTVD